MLPIKSLEVAVSLALSTKPVKIFTESVAINATTNIFISKLNIVPIAFSDKNFNCPITPNGNSCIVISAIVQNSIRTINRIPTQRRQEQNHDCRHYAYQSDEYRQQILLLRVFPKDIEEIQRVRYYLVRLHFDIWVGISSVVLFAAYGTITADAQLYLNRILTLRFQIASQPAKISSKGGLTVIFNDERLIPIIKDAPNGSELKIFYFIAHNQPSDGIRGFRITKIQLAVDLNLKLPTIFKAIKWLKDNLLIQELKLVEDSDFMANPYLVMNNSDRDERINEWKRRQRLDIQNEVRLAKQRRLRQLRKANKK